MPRTSPIAKQLGRGHGRSRLHGPASSGTRTSWKWRPTRLCSRTSTRQWAPDLIWFDNLRAFGTPSYYVQKLFATNLGGRILPIDAPNAQNGLYTSAALDTNAREVILKAVNSGKTPRSIKLSLTGASASGTARALVIGTEDLAAENSLEKPANVAPEEKSVAVTGSSAELTLAPNSLTILRVPIR